EWTPYFDEARRLDDLWASDVEFSEICLPWFHSADKHFITHEMHGFTGSMALRFVVPHRGVLELWLEAVVTGPMDANAHQKLQHIGSVPGQDHIQDMYREAYSNVKVSERESGILATF
ncbi:hypothetical protein K458DRAFT_263213, partial [Lentithecium fluviatile CBS 122367]